MSKRHSDSKITVLLGFLLVLLLLTVLFTFFITITNTEDAKLIDIAGRQRLLSQMIVKETLTFVSARETESSDSENLKEILVKTVSLFGTSLNALRDGGPTLGADGNETSLPESSGNIKRQFMKVTEIWRPMKDSIGIIIDPKEDAYSIKFSRAIIKLKEDSIPLLNESNKAVVLLQKVVEKKAAIISSVEITAFFLIIFTAAISLFLNNNMKTINAQLRLMIDKRKRAEDELQKAHDELEIRVKERTEDLTAEVTWRKLMEGQLRKLSRAVEQSPSTVVITDTKGDIEYVNPRFSQLSGYSLKKSVGKNPRILKSGTMPSEFYKELWDTITKGETWHGEFHNKKMNGELYWEAATISPVRNDEGEITNFIKVSEDITKKKELEERDKLRTTELENLVESLNKLVKELHLNVQQAKQLLELVHGEQPRYIELVDYALFFHAILLPCNEEGGDHYFVQKTPHNKTIVSLKDQSGHAVGCVLRSIITDLFYKSMINNNNHQTLEKLLDKLNRNMYKAKLYSEDEFFTSIDVEIDNESLKMRYASGGHPPFIVIRGDQILTFPEEGGNGHNLPLAIFEDTHFSTGEFQLQCGDKLIFYTDGLTESTIKDGTEAISTEKLIEMVSRYAALPVSDIVNNLVCAVAEMAGETIDSLKNENSSEDDITILGLEIENSNTYYEEIVQPKGVEELDCFFNDLLDRLLVEWRERGFEQEDRLTYVFTESLSNAYKHGNRGDTGKSIYVRWRWGNDLHFEVIDEGEGFDCKNIPDPTRPDKLEHFHGRGIFLIRYCADHVSWRDSGRHLKAVFQKQQKPVQENDIADVKEYIDLWRDNDSLSL